MEFTLSGEEREQLRMIADAIQRKANIETNEALVAALIRKCMIRTNGKELKLTELGRRHVQN